VSQLAQRLSGIRAPRLTSPVAGCAPIARTTRTAGEPRPPSTSTRNWWPPIASLSALTESRVFRLSIKRDIRW